MLDQLNSIYQSLTSNKKIFILQSVIIVVLIILLGLVLLKPGDSKIITDKNPSSLVVLQIKNVSELTTAIFVMDKVIPITEKGMLSDWFDSKLLYVANGSLRVGIDLSKLKNEDVKVDNDKIIINLPSLQILDSKIDVNHSYVYDFKKGFLNTDPITLQTKAEQQAIKEIESAACTEWLLKTANDRVKQSINQLLSQLLKDKGYTEVIVQIQSHSLESCQGT